MLNIQALIQELIRIRNEVDQISGRANVPHVVVAYDVCTGLIEQLQGIFEVAQKEANSAKEEEVIET